MYAVIVTGGKQYRVIEGQTLKIEKLEVEPGKTIEFEQVLMVSDGENIQIGAPFIEGMKVSAEVVSQGRAPKVRILKFRRRKHHMKQMGHRQYLTQIKITAIGEGSSKSAAEKPKAAKKTAAKKTTEE